MPVGRYLVPFVVTVRRLACYCDRTSLHPEAGLVRIPNNLQAQTMLFAKYGARGPVIWGKSQLEEGIAQLQRFLFLRQAWSQVIDGQDWVQSWLKAADQSPGSLHATAANAKPG